MSAKGGAREKRGGRRVGQGQGSWMKCTTLRAACLYPDGLSCLYQGEESAVLSARPVHTRTPS
jgi:hypothetical protein